MKLRDGEFLYQVKSANEPYERVVPESQLSDRSGNFLVTIYAPPGIFWPMEEKHSLTDLELIGRHKASFKLDPYRVYELLYP